MLRYCRLPVAMIVIVIVATLATWVARFAAVFVVGTAIIVMTERVVQVGVARIAVLRTVAYALVASFMVFVLAIVMSFVAVTAITAIAAAACIAAQDGRRQSPLLRPLP